jgi:hypothetical protein
MTGPSGAFRVLCRSRGYLRRVDQKPHFPEGTGDRKQTVTCALCRAAAPVDPPPVSWTCSVENGERKYVCEDCARANIRAIEGRLDSSWW